MENLSGSGLIAGETSLAYEEIFTITLVTGRSVGIGAYLVRLGQRAVQTDGLSLLPFLSLLSSTSLTLYINILIGPIILTGAPALNKVLGKDVYDSNTQIGGPQIMYPNGITHVAVPDDLGGVVAIVKWLSYISARTGVPAPVYQSIVDDPERDIEFSLGGKYDVRHMLAGRMASTSSPLSFT